MENHSLKYYKLSTICLYMVSSLTLTLNAKQAYKTARIAPVVISAVLNKKDGIYKKNEQVKISLSVIDKNKEPRVKFLDCQLFINGKNVEKRMVPYGKNCIFLTSLDKPGWVAAKAIACGQNKKPIFPKYPKNKFDKLICGGIGAMVDPYNIKAASDEPVDFDHFWKKQRRNLDKVPIKATLKKIDFEGKFKGKIICYNAKVTCAGGMPVSGYLAIPKDAKPKSLAAVVFFDGAGVRSATKPLWYRKAIAFHINAHGIDNGQSNEYYNKIKKNTLRLYKYQGKNSRDEFYFKGMHLRAMRALDYVKSRPEWNGKTLVVFGGSMGGGQAIAAAALDDQVTDCLAIIPALGDLTGEVDDRIGAYPQVLKSKDVKLKNEAIINTVGYFDSANFAKRIKSNIVLTTGLIDFTCPPTSVYLIYNSLPAKTEKQILIFPKTAHKYITPPEGHEILQKVW